MKVDIVGTRSRSERQAIARLVRRVLGDEKCPAREISIVLTSNREIRRLNRRFLGRDRNTDVMAFPISDELLGEIYVSRDQARTQAVEYGLSPDSELRRLVLHGLLHLLGYSHRRMQPQYRRYLGMS